MRPLFCPNCATPLLLGVHGAQPWSAAPGPYSEESEEGWDCFCNACYWSGDIMPDYLTAEALETARREQHAS